MYHYFVSYFWSDKNGQQKISCSMLTVEEKITSKTNLFELCNKLAEASVNVDNVVILNFILLDE